MAQKTAKVDFLNGSVWRCVVAQAIPLTVAQLIHLLYNVVDRVYLGHMGDGNSMALTGVGLTFPIVSLIMAFTALFGNGGVPLFSIERGAGNEEKASHCQNFRTNHAPTKQNAKISCGYPSKDGCHARIINVY